MSSIWTAVVAVAGTLLGSGLTYLFQRLTLRRTAAEARSEKRREEFTNAVAAYASVAATLRRAEFDRAKKRLEGVKGESREAVRQETYHLRAEAQSAYYLVRLLADPDVDGDLVRDAEEVISRSRSITADSNMMSEAVERSDEAAEALRTFIDRANRRLSTF
ncbi:hypothetical protein ACGFMK_38670 [Amycolatopsis sp. NPDC049252]|uniref:hypothetical protein n=1 Tax=Amycolatopsis sp. NPDC049252 TaxID=3363933 RepID=UPI0037104B19